MKSLTAFLLLFTAASVSAQTSYVCQPCGSSCDATVYHAPGTCTTCNMPLVDKATIKFTSLSPMEFCARMSDPNVIILDVRSPQEFDGSTTRTNSFGHFKNAININIDELERRVDELSKYKSKEILVYCSHSRRSPRASYFLGQQGFSKVINMSGGVSTIAESATSECISKNYVVHPH